MSEYIVKVYGPMPDAIYERQREEIVRCSDCEHYEQRAEVRKQTFTVSSEPWCNKLVKCVEPNRFCAWGEKRES